MTQRYHTEHFADYAAWSAAGHPIGGIFPLVDRDRTPDATPERYRSVETLYYIALPTHQLWCPWQKAFNVAQGYHGDGWDITGAWSRWTAQPSIQVDGWHGYLTKGILHESSDSVTP